MVFREIGRIFVEKRKMNGDIATQQAINSQSANEGKMKTLEEQQIVILSNEFMSQ